MQYHSHCLILNIVTTDRLIALWLDLRVANLYTAGRTSSLWHWESSQCQRLAAGILPRPSMALWQRKPRNFNFGENPFLHTRWGLILIIETTMSPGFGWPVVCRLSNDNWQSCKYNNATRKNAKAFHTCLSMEIRPAHIIKHAIDPIPNTRPTKAKLPWYTCVELEFTNKILPEIPR